MERMSARINSVLFNFLWSSAPILVSIISFMTYVMRGHQLTISKAFTVRFILKYISIFFEVYFFPGYCVVRYGEVRPFYLPGVAERYLLFKPGPLSMLFHHTWSNSCRCVEVSRFLGSLQAINVEGRLALL